MDYFVKLVCEGCEVKIDAEKHLYTTCLKCGKEYKVDVYELLDLIENGLDVFHERPCCSECNGALGTEVGQ